MIYDKIEEIEGRLESVVPPHQKKLLLFGLPLLILGAFYFLYITTALENIEENEETIATLTKKSQKNSIPLVSKKIAQKKKQILKQKTDIATKKQEILQLHAQLQKQNFLFVTQEGTGRFLQNMLRSSVKNNVLIHDVNITQENEHIIGDLYIQESVHVSAEGKFLNDVVFLRSLEENTMLLKLENILIETKGSVPRLHFNINFYGIKKYE